MTGCMSDQIVWDVSYEKRMRGLLSRWKEKFGECVGDPDQIGGPVALYYHQSRSHILTAFRLLINIGGSGETLGWSNMIKHWEEAAIDHCRMHAEEANVESPRVFDASSSTNKKFRRRERNKCCMIGKLGRVSRHFTFYRLHAAYFGVLTIVGTISLWLSRKRSNISFVDCIFNAVSALTVTGLLSLRVRDFTTFGMFALMLLMLFGSHVFTSLLPLYVRRFHFFRYNTAHHAAVNGNGSNTSDNPITICKSDQVFSSDSDLELKVIKEGFTDDPPINHEDGSDYDTMSDDCVQISLEQQALMTLCWLVPLFFVGVQCLGFLIIVCYNAAAPPRIRNLYNEENINPTFFAIFSSISAFSNTGISPLDENMMPFQTSSLLVPLAVLILAGNTMFPPSMRFIIWSLYHCTRSKNPQKKVYEYLLRYPRRCYTHLFPQAQTNWLVVTVLAFNAIDFLAFCALDWKLEAVEGTHVTVGTKLMDGIFQSLNTRSAGMNVVSLRDLSPPMLVLYVGMM